VKSNKLRLIVFPILLIIAITVAFYVWADEKKEKSKSDLDELHNFATVFHRIREYYVDEKDPEELINAAIEGMLGRLDRHSVYLDEYQYQNLMIDTKGKFGGLGISISIRDDFPTVISPIEDTPAYRLGIQGGDRIVEIEGVSTKGWNSEQAVTKLRGPPGTQVNITISREGLEDSLYYEITREEINVPSITYHSVLGDSIGYVRIARFSQTTASDLEDILEDFDNKYRLEGLILDLRSNPGGLLEAAREVSELFLKKGRLIVYTESRIPNHNRRFKSEARRAHDGYPVVVMVNQASASASEIVAGALQDWDRGVIVGQQTFGKGSVQTVFTVDDKSALKLTTQKYFTPSGRSIQKHNDHEDNNGEEEEESKEYRTNGGRLVYGGGGITPDWKIELPDLTEFQRELILNGVFFSFAVHYTAYNEPGETFEVTGDVLEEFKKFILDKGVEFTEEQWEKQENIDYIKLGIKREVFRNLYGTKGAYQATLTEDEEVQRVLEMFSQTSSLSEMFEYVENMEAMAKADQK
jgi:carboxyl-terminal processing protease